LRTHLPQDRAPNSPFTCKIPPAKLLRVPVAHGEGCYFADAPTLDKLVANQQILWQYCNAKATSRRRLPNGSVKNIAGICNERRNVAV